VAAYLIGGCAGALVAAAVFTVILRRYLNGPD
jgi:nitrate reductase gamma subunit